MEIMKTVKLVHPIKIILTLFIILVAVAALVIGCGGGKTTSTPNSSGTWELTGSLFAHDPTVIKAGSIWYLFYTGPGVQLKTSADGLAWSNPSKVIPDVQSWWLTYAPAMDTNNIWAPDIFYYNGTYWLYYAVSEYGKRNSAIGLATCTNPALGNWVDQGVVVYSSASDTVNKYNCIDPNVFEDVNGGMWLSFGSYGTGIYMVQLDKTTMKPAKTKPGDDPTLTHLTYRPKVLSNDSNGSPQAIECPSLIYHNGYYYLFVSFDGCCNGSNSTYKIAYGRATSMGGPYLDQSGRSMLDSGGTIFDQDDGRWIPGGQFIYKDGSQWLCVHHAYDKNNGGIATLRIKNLYFDADGWPTYTKP